MRLLLGAAAAAALWVHGAAWAADTAIATTLVAPPLKDTNVSLLRKPATPTPNQHIGVFIMHSFSGYSDFSACRMLAERGFTTLCADSVYSNRKPEYKGYEDHAAAITAGIKFLRAQPGITKVVLFGHSMGAPMMTFYEAVQEKGVAFCQDPQRLLPCATTNLEDAAHASTLQPVDGIILFDAHLGDAMATFTYMDPAVTDPAQPTQRDATLDMFARANGFPGDAPGGKAPKDSATYGADFRARYFAAQAERNAAVLKSAQALYARIAAHDKGVYGDDMAFSVPASENAARMWQADLGLVNCTQRPQMFLSHDGNALSKGPVCSDRLPSASAADDNSFKSTLNISAVRWLGAHAMRTNGAFAETKDDITGLDYSSTNTSAMTHVAAISRPLLIVANGAHYFLRPDEMIFDAAASSDKTFAIEEGAVHGGEPCGPCAEAKGHPAGFYGDTLGRTYDFMAAWLAQRF